MSEATGFCYFPLKNYQEFFVIQGSNSGAPTRWILISPLSCSPSPKVVAVSLILCIIIFCVFDVVRPPQSWKYFVGGVFPHCLCPLGSCLPRSYAFSSVRCLLLWAVPFPHFLLSPGGRGPVPWEPYCSLCYPFLLLWVLEVVDLAKDCSACAVWPHQAWERRGGRRLQSLFTMPTQ